MWWTEACSACLYFLLDASWASAPGLLSQTRHSSLASTATAWTALAHLQMLSPYASMLLQTQKWSLLITLKPHPAEAAVKELCKSCSSWAGVKQCNICQYKWAALLIPSPCMAELITWGSLVCCPCCCAASPAAQTPAHSTGRDLEPFRTRSPGSQQWDAQLPRQTVRKTSLFFPYLLSHPGKRFGLYCVKIYTK